MVIALYPGHAGKDCGAIDGVDVTQGDVIHTIEAVITTGIVSKMSLFLTVLGIDHVVASGGWDYRIAATKSCTAGISIHADTCNDVQKRGYHCMYYPGSIKGKQLAESIDKALESIAPRARMPHAENLKILRDTVFPAVLVEAGFLSNTVDEALLSNNEHQYNLAFAIIAGLREHMYKR